MGVCVCVCVCVWIKLDDVYKSALFYLKKKLNVYC